MLANVNEPILWGIAPELQRPAILYSVRLLSILLGRPAVVLRPEELPTSGDLRIVYSDTGESVYRAPAIRCDLTFWRAAETGTYTAPTRNIDWHGTVAPVWTHEDGSDPDIVAATFFHVSRLEEFAQTERDQHGRYRAEDSWLVRAGLIERPVVHDYANALGRLIGLRSGPVRHWRGDAPFAVAFTHDIDRLRMHGEWSEELLHWKDRLVRGDGLGVISKRLASRRRTHRGRQSDPYETFEVLMRQHETHGFDATFYWIAAEPSPHDADYVVTHDEIAKLIRSVQKRGFETGLHGSYNSYLSADTLTKERDTLVRAALAPIVSTRQHYLRFDARHTWKAQDDAAMQTDSSLGYSERAGFRAGIAVPFQPWSFPDNAPLDLWEVPLAMMEVTLKEYMHLDIDEAIDKSRKILDTLLEYGAGAAILWHNSSLNDLDWQGWDRVYDDWLGNVRRMEGWGTSVGRIVDSWRRWSEQLGNV